MIMICEKCEQRPADFVSGLCPDCSEQEQREINRGSGWGVLFFIIVAMLAFLLGMLTGCVGYRKTASSESLVGIGLDADRITLASGATLEGVNTSRAIKDGGQAIKDLARMRLNTSIVTTGIKAAQNVTKEVAQ
jgi:hypothetical protein